MSRGMNTKTTYRWETMEPFAFTDGVRMAGVCWEKSYRGGLAVADRTCTSVRSLDTFGPRVDVKTESK